MAKKKKKPRPPQSPPTGQFSVSAEDVMRVLNTKAQFDKELRLQIEAAQWEVASSAEQVRRLELETKLLEMAEEEEEEEDEDGSS